ncbi:helix-turn-helix domain-containing protein [Dysgonomonas termitidis]|uniref:Helix-turn-helix domain-containing protein n=1 Tax=Dysgonomonas termitidis TaxID=1516126 RepID=A0ABV9KQ23_9BACT
MSLRIKEVLKEKGLSINEVAEIMGISRVGLSQHINGNPSSEVLVRIAKAIGCSASEFFEPLKENIIICPKCGNKMEVKEKSDG